jgi:hypothetical protein
MMTGDPYKLDNVDGRSPRARRFRDIVDNLVAQGFRAAGDDAVRELAGLRFTLEETQAAVISGDNTGRADIVRLANLISRREKDIRETLRQKPTRTEDLHEYLAGTHG